MGRDGSTTMVRVRSFLPVLHLDLVSWSNTGDNTAQGCVKGVCPDILTWRAQGLEVDLSLWPEKKSIVP